MRMHLCRPTALLLFLAICAACASPRPVDGVGLTPASPCEVMPDSAYAAGAEWFERNEVILIRGLRHVRYGAARTLSPAGLTRVGDYQGVPLFTLADDRWAGMVFVPVRPGCVFQAYEPPHR